MEGCFFARCGCPDDRYSDARLIYCFEIAVFSSDSDCLVLNVLVLRLRNKSVLAVSFAELWTRIESVGSGMVLRRMVTIRRELRKNFLILSALLEMSIALFVCNRHLC